MLAIALGPLVIGGPLGLTPDLLEFSQRGQTLAELNGRYDGLLVGYLLAMALLVWIAAILGIAWRTWSTPRPHGVRPDYRPVAAAAALWIVLAAGAMYLPVGPKSERTVILPPPAAQTNPSQSATAR
ncbi:MAG: hypothetical protein JHD16_13670 [Solirubrobacteraceae bacterium]|nr:hypothetical protein [Solirubrobacteraceae bacterium]